MAERTRLRTSLEISSRVREEYLDRVKEFYTHSLHSIFDFDCARAC